MPRKKEKSITKEEKKKQNKLLQARYKRPLTPRAVFTAHLYGNPASPTFNSLAKSFYNTYPLDKPVSKRYANKMSKELVKDPRFNKELKKVYKQFMPNDKVEYNTDFVLELLKDELTAEDPQAVFAGKKLLLEHMNKLTDMFYRYDHNKEDIAPIEEAETEELLARAQQLLNQNKQLLSNNSKQDDKGQEKGSNIS